jgi:hypothetical protein
MKTWKSTQQEKIRAMTGGDKRYHFAPDLARERAGVGADYDNPATPPRDQSAPQAAGDKGNLQGQGYRNDTGKDWLIGDGERDPVFDHQSGRTPQPRSPSESGRGARRR